MLCKDSDEGQVLKAEEVSICFKVLRIFDGAENVPNITQF